MGSLIFMAWRETFEAVLFALLSLSPVSYAADIPTYTMVAQAGQLTPATLEVAAEQRFKVVIRNQGSDDIKFESLQLRRKEIVGVGKESSLIIASLTPGEYNFFDEFHITSSQGRIIAK
ncbi:Cupredoxin domain-containing protein [Gammaproteobacteria bacterium]